ncbi:MAG TPA: NAD(P)H-dependent oxidoreductase [Pseudonocardiaceae bacterium]|jgi:NAD(P)H-dependent FMN reductase|nr:NAD(P)H-dependent oxidoreductase [Pseudonocardiaceae bacterium]
MTQPRLQIIIGSTRPGRRGVAVGQWFHDAAVRHDRFDIELIDLLDVGLPLLDEPQRGPYSHAHSERWSRTISAGNAYVFVVPEYNHSFNAATKNAIDYLTTEWRHKPVGFVGYGGAVGGARAVQALVPVVVSLDMRPLSRSVHIPQIGRAITADGTLHTNDRLDNGALTLLDELFHHFDPQWTERGRQNGVVEPGFGDRRRRAEQGA